MNVRLPCSCEATRDPNGHILIVELRVIHLVDVEFREHKGVWLLAKKKPRETVIDYSKVYGLAMVSHRLSHHY